MSVRPFRIRHSYRTATTSSGSCGNGRLPKQYETGDLYELYIDQRNRAGIVGRRDCRESHGDAGCCRGNAASGGHHRHRGNAAGRAETGDPGGTGSAKAARNPGDAETENRRREGRRAILAPRRPQESGSAGKYPESRTHMAGVQQARPGRGLRRAVAAAGARKIPGHRQLQSRRVLYEADRWPQTASRGGSAPPDRGRPDAARADRRKLRRHQEHRGTEPRRLQGDRAIASRQRHRDLRLWRSEP